MGFVAIVLAAGCGGAAHPASATTPTPAPPPPGAPPAPDGSATMCANHPDALGPWLLTAAQVPLRFGTGITQLPQIETSQQKPVEVCGVPAENQWLAAATCADGSHPYRSPSEVEKSRAGSTGAGGRCGGILDLYKVPCPEKTYDVYIDMNLCGPGESFQ